MRSWRKKDGDPGAGRGWVREKKRDLETKEASEMKQAETRVRSQNLEVLDKKAAWEQALR